MKVKKLIHFIIVVAVAFALAGVVVEVVGVVAHFFPPFGENLVVHESNRLSMALFMPAIALGIIAVLAAWALRLNSSD